ncbi:uncharacterized protein ACIQIH_008527 isoform 1-T1 [Cyanocitta cristata]
MALVYGDNSELSAICRLPHVVLQVPEADSDPCSHRCYRFSQNPPFHVREQQLEDVFKCLCQWSVEKRQRKGKREESKEVCVGEQGEVTGSLLECWPGFGRSQVDWSSEVFPVRNPCWGCFPWLSQGEGTALQFLQPQAVDASPENQFRIVHLTLPLTCGFQGAFWSSGYSQERVFQHLLFKLGIPNPDEEARPAEEEDEEVWEDGDSGHQRLGKAQIQMLGLPLWTCAELSLQGTVRP